MTPQDTERELKNMLVAADYNFDTPNPFLAWSVFKEFSSLPVEGVDNGFLWQVGCFDFTGEKLCYLDYVCQFTFYEDDEYDHMEQLHIEFTSTPTAELLILNRNKWAFDYPSLADYFKVVESFDEFKAALKHSSWKVTVYLEEV